MRAQLDISIGNIFPQTQTADGSYTRNALSRNTANNFLNFGIPGVRRYYSQYNFGFNLAWELDFWGRFRRAIESNEASLEASVADYDDVLVTLLGDVATNYVQYRTLQEQIDFSRFNVELQKQTLTIVECGSKPGRPANSTCASREARWPRRRPRSPNLKSACDKRPTVCAL